MGRARQASRTVDTAGLGGAQLKAYGYLALLALALLVLAVSGAGQTARLALGSTDQLGNTGRQKGSGQQHGLVYAAPVWVTCAISLVVLAVAFGVVAAAGQRRRRSLVSTGVILGTLAFLIGFFAWAARGQQASLSGILVISVGGAIPIILGSTAGVFSDRSGVLNIAIEAEFLAGAFAAAFLGSVLHSAWLGLFAGIVGGLAVGAVLAVVTLHTRVDQVVAGIVLISVVTGITGYLTEQVLDKHPGTLNSPPTLGTVQIPVLHNLPVVGEALFGQNAVFYLAVLCVVAVEVLLRRTPLGLRIRAAGENPAAAESSGVRVRRLRYLAVITSGGIAGIGGAYFAVVASGQFVAGMSSGLGYVALAAVILGGWRAAQAAAGALLFGFASSIATVFGLLNVHVPPALLLTVPYLVTIFVVAGVVTRGRAPAASGMLAD